MEPYYESPEVTLWHGDCLEVLRTLPDASVHSVVTDPPYGLEFMGKEWDAPWKADGSVVADPASVGGFQDGNGGNPYSRIRFGVGAGFQQWCEQWTVECLRVLKPGGHLLAFGGTRTWHRLACAIEDAGFEVRDSIAWMYGSGFAKSWNFKTQFGGAWCECEGGNALPYDHADNADLSRVRDDVHPPAVARREGDVLLAQVQRSGAGSGVGEARPQGSRGMVAGVRDAGGRSDARREEPRLEGRDVHRAGQGLSDGADAESPASTGEWLRGRAPAGDGVADRAGGDASRGGASHQRGPGGQSAGEPEALRGSHVALDDGALRDGPVCARCGGLDPFYRGAGSALKPAHEPIVVARKPLSGTLASTVLAHGTGALNIDRCRVEGEFTSGWSKSGSKASENDSMSGPNYARDPKPDNPAGRWPANVVLDEDQAAALDEQSGESQARIGKSRGAAPGDDWGMTATGAEYDDLGGASRFYYVAKADASERPKVGGVAHPTVKPIALMRWLVRLVTPPGGIVLEPFAGSGTTVEACLIEGFRCVAIEKTDAYLPLIEARIHRRRDPVAAARLADNTEDSLFDLLDEAGA